MGNSESGMLMLADEVGNNKENSVVTGAVRYNKNRASPTGAQMLIIHSRGYQGMLQVESHHSCADVRYLVEDEFDADMLPSSNFYFSVQGIRLTQKQEARYMAFHMMNYKVVLMAKNANNKREEQQPPNESPAKKVCVEETAPERASETKTVEEELLPALECRSRSPSSVSKEDGKEMQIDNENLDDEEDEVETEETGEIARMEASTSLKSNQPKPANDTADDDEDFSTHDDDDDQTVAFDDEKDQSSDNEHESATISEANKTDEAIASTDSEPTEEAVAKAESVKSDEAVAQARKDTPMEEEEEDDDIQDATEAPATDPHKLHNQALEQSTKVLQETEQLLEGNPLFCSQDRRAEWKREIKDILQKSTPKTIVGVLGNTGVGKSSLLNALLDEAAVLPTSGSRGCTAAVVELRFNESLRKKPTDGVDAADDNADVTVYKGEVEFITLVEWANELKILVDECSTHEEKTIYARPPEEQRQPDAAAAWSKINQVYGRGTMENYHGKAKDGVYHRLVNNHRVVKLLTPKPDKANNSVFVQAGSIASKDAESVQQGFTKLPARLRRNKKKWAQAFRRSINDYVYRKGNGNQPQTWPLIRKVVLEGPWAVLSTGACLVDLPGVRDANAARAKVSENYLQNCNEIWIVAPIKRAVDDGTAKELLGEQFKRRLLMDGAYGNVSFICTQTDDCEATETMRDHQDVATKLGYWDRMNDMSNELGSIEKELSDLQQEEDDFKVNWEEAKELLAGGREELKEAEMEAAEEEEDDELPDFALLKELRGFVESHTKAESYAMLEVHSWRQDNSKNLKKLRVQSRKLQKRLKSLCALVRNEYSKTCLQEDFRAGLEELTRKPDDEEGGNAIDEIVPTAVIPDDFQINVYCISANDYLKVQGIKPSSDGPPNTFSRATDTQIPNLRSFVHATTAKHCITSTEAFVNEASDLLDCVKLVAADAKDAPGGRLPRKCKTVFEKAMSSLVTKLDPIGREFRDKMEKQVRTALHPSLKAGAAKGNAAALSTVNSWGSKSRRGRDHRSPQMNGLYYSTYFATARRHGVYVSGSAGAIDMNQELVEPMEKEFSSDWQRTMDASVAVFLRASEEQVAKICAAIDKELAAGFVGAGMDSNRVSTMINAAKRTCNTSLKASFQAMKQVAINSQRELNRSLLPKVQTRMHSGYDLTVSVQGGPGKFNRMKDTMATFAGGTVTSMFDESTTELLESVGNLIEHMAAMISALPQTINKILERVYSVCWDDQSDKTAFVDPEQMQKIRECRDKLLPDIQRLIASQGSAMELLGIKREELDLDVMGVASWDDQYTQKLTEAESKGDVVDLLDSDDEYDVKMPAAPVAARRPVRVKREMSAYI